VYWIDLQSRIATKLPVRILFDTDSYPDIMFVDENRSATKFYKDSDSLVNTLIQSRPIKLELGLKTSYRVVVRGYFKGEDSYSYLIVLGSYDGLCWQPIGLKTMSLIDGFTNIGCVTDRVSCKYMMVIVAGTLSKDSHIDYIDVTSDNKYKNKLK
jgi:hypothetical protein